MALQYHPDVCHPSRSRDESARLFVELHKAYKVLSDPISRRKYDRELSLIGKSERTYKTHDQAGDDEDDDDDDDGISRDQWIEQLFELKKRSQYRMSTKAEVSWRCRAQHN
ncbi:DnaJ domain [Macleaya cordata]|uniref:DnaJ domain n=1 Tax=Macleaya cordata TaxID=56857 RepID=A0A200QPZ0_MACCD|nr:DnaJ domain [Macleaya cordata]